MATVKESFDINTHSLSYLAYDLDSKDGVVIDPVLHYDSASGTVIPCPSTLKMMNDISELSLKLHFIFETHIHADHMSAAQSLKSQYPNANTAIHENICLVQKTFKDLFNFDESFDVHGKSFDVEYLDEVAEWLAQRPGATVLYQNNGGWVVEL